MKHHFVLLGFALVVALSVQQDGRAEPIAPGVDYLTYDREGPVKVYVVAFDRARPEYQLKVGWAQGRRNFSARSTTSAIARLYDSPPDHDVIAAVNGSFFESVAPLIQGATASAGEILEAPNGKYDTFLFGPARVPTIREDVRPANGVLYFANNVTTTIHQYNRAAAVDKLTAYTPAWGPTTGTTREGVEVLLADVSYPMRGNKEVSGIVTAVKTGAASTNNAIPVGGMVLHAHGAAKDVLLANTAVGDRLRMRFATSAAEFNNADMAITGAGWILRNGAANTSNWAAYSSSFVDSRHPRTILAWNDARLFLVVVDGRTSASIGMTFPEMAAFLVDTLGAAEAVNLDGGGSSTLVVDGTVRNRPSDGAERAVANAVLLVREDPPPALPFFDPFGRGGRLPGWDDKFTYNDVRAFSPHAPGGDGYVLHVADAAGGVETVRRGDLADADYSVAADIFCEYRPDVAADGFERCGIFARDSGTGAFDMAAYGSGNCYCLTYDSDDGRIRAGVIVNGVLTDFLESDRLFADWTSWHRFRIDCKGSSISFFVDGESVASVVDTRHPRGYFGIGYHEFFRSNSNIHGTRADNFAATRLGPPPGQAPYLGSPFAVPGLIQAEHYDLGGPVVAYHDRTPGNAGGHLRNDDVDIDSCGDHGGGYAVGSLEAGEWLEYLVNVAATGRYDIRLRVASATASESFRVEMNGRDVTGKQTFPPTGGSDEWATVTVTGAALEAGEWQILRLVAESGGWAVNFLEIVEAVPPPAAATRPSPARNAGGVSVSVRLSWAPAAGASAYHVYLGTSAPGEYRGTQTTTTFDPGPLRRGTRYYWRVDAVNESGVTPGDVWEFTTEGVRNVAADFDGDGDVDGADFARLQACFNGANRPPAGADCVAADLDQDDDVDVSDFNLFQACFNGASRPPACP